MKTPQIPPNVMVAPPRYRRAILLSLVGCLILGCPGAPSTDESQSEAVLGTVAGRTQPDNLAAGLAPDVQVLSVGPVVPPAQPLPNGSGLQPTPVAPSNSLPIAPRVVTRATSQVWYEATPGAHGSVVSQGAGQPLRLSYDASGGAVQSQWTVKMMLANGDALTRWTQELTGNAADAAIIAVQSYNYTGSPFPEPMTATFGPAPNLLVDAGGSTTTQVAPGSYAILEFALVYNFDGTDTGARTIQTEVGSQGWAMAGSADAPLVQFGDNAPVTASANVTLGKPVIILTASTQAPTITCPADMTVECDGSGNTAQLQAWLASATVSSTCTNLIVANDFTALSDECGATGSATVKWTVKDDCGTATCSAKFTIVDTTPPTLTVPADKTVECDGSGNTAEVQAWLASATATDTCGDVRVTNDFAALSDECGATGSATVSWTATDDCGNKATGSAKFTIVDATPPVITLKGQAEMTLECGVDEYAEPGATVADACDTALTTATVGGDAVDTHKPGVYVVTYDATDACGNAAAQVKRTVTVVDTLAPEVTVGDMKLLWPPSHQYVSLTLADLNVTVVDACAGELDINQVGRVLSIYSDEPEDAKGEGDGHTTADIVIRGPASFALRAERAGAENGRVYGIRFEVTDESGNKTEATCFVGVPHDQSGKPPVDDGPDEGYTVTP